MKQRKREGMAQVAESQYPITNTLPASSNYPFNVVNTTQMPQ